MNYRTSDVSIFSESNFTQPSLANKVAWHTLYVLLVFTPLVRGAVHDWAVSIIHLLTLLSLTAFLLDRALTQHWQRIRTAMDKPIFCLMMLAVLSCFRSVHPYSSLWATVLLMNYVTIFYLIVHIVTDRSRLRNLIYLIIGMGVFLSIFGLLKRFGMNPFPWWNYGNLNYPSEFLSAVYGNHNHFAGYMEMVIPMMLGLFLFSFSGVKLLLMFVMLTAMILSLSRGGWISCFLSLSFMCFALLTDPHFKRKGLMLFLILLTSFAFFIIIGSTSVVERMLTATQKAEDESLDSRITAWKGILDMIADYPVCGTGPGTYALAVTKYQPPGLNSRFTTAHNDYLHFISEVGLPLIAILVWMMIALYRAGFRKLENPGRLVRGTTLGALSGITAVLFHSAVDFNLHIPANAILFTVLAAVVAAPIPRIRKNHSFPKGGALMKQYLIPNLY